MWARIVTLRIVAIVLPKGCTNYAATLHHISSYLVVDHVVVEQERLVIVQEVNLINAGNEHLIKVNDSSSIIR